MRKNSWSYRFSALVMLILFTFSITPKLFLHDLFANHTDAVHKKTDDGKAQVTKTGFTCDCNDLVATSPFTEHRDATELPILFDYQVWVSHFPPQIISNPQYFFELRGPPSLG